MKLKFLIYAGCIFFVLSAFDVESQELVTPHIYTVDSSYRHDDSQSVDQLGWLTGTWRGKGLGGEVEEIWSAPMHGHMVNTFRYHRGGELVFSEFCSISESPDGISYRVKHFNPDFSGWESKDDYVNFPLIRIEDNKVYFNGASFMVEGDTLTIYVLLSGDEGTREEAFVYRRVR